MIYRLSLDGSAGTVKYLSFAAPCTTGGGPHNPDDVAIVQAILAMARQLKIRVVAEGVETPAQYRFLRDHRCEEAQGYAFSRPLPAEACADFLAKTPLYAVASR